MDVITWPFLPTSTYSATISFVQTGLQLTASIQATLNTQVVLDMEFPTTEHYYMYRKALFHGDKQAAKKIYRTDDPKEAKRITTKFDNFDTSGWKRKQYKVMETACLAKFRQNSSLRHELFRTCNAVLVEASPSDVRWYLLNTL